MDSVKQFIANNSHQFGYIMDEASKQWIKKDPLGALTVGPCKGTIDANGSYLELLHKLESTETEDRGKNALSLKVDVDTKEANENIKELIAAANECVKAFEKLGKVMNKSNNASKPINIGAPTFGSALIPDIVPSIKNSHFLRP